MRYLIGFADGQSVETVWMPEGDGGEAGDGSEAGEEAEVWLNHLGAKAAVSCVATTERLEAAPFQQEVLRERRQIGTFRDARRFAFPVRWVVPSIANFV